MAFSLVRKNKRFTNKKPTNTTLKGFWEWTTYRKQDSNDNEEVIKSKIPTGNFDHHKIDNMINPQKSLIEIVIDKEKAGLKLNNADKIRLENYKEKNKNAIDRDLKEIEKHNLNSVVKTDTGRIIKLFIIAENKIKDYNMVYYIFQKLSEFDIPKDILEKYNSTYQKMLSIVSKLNTIHLQFNKFYSNMPPLNIMGFHKLDDWQIKVINNINNKISTLVQAPTSGGKSILTGFLYTKKVNVLVIVPTAPLCLQMAAMIGKISNQDIPILTRTHQTIIKRDEMIEKVNRTGILVGTPCEILDYLPLINIKFDWVVIDEIHMMGKELCCEMETICKLYYDTPLLALSATIGNVYELRDWLITTGVEKVDIIKCDKRFFNLQKFYYCGKENNFNRIHPLSMVNIQEFIDGTVILKQLNPTPPDTYDLYEKLNEQFSLDDLDI